MTFPESQRQARLLGIALLAATFLIGGLAGAAAVRLSSSREARAAAQHAEERGPRERGAGSVLDQLDLTPEQCQRIQAVLERRRQQTEAFWEEHGPTLRAIVDSAHAEIRAVLTPEQRAEYDRLRAERRLRPHKQNGSQKGCDQ